MGSGQGWTRSIHALAVGAGGSAPILFSHLDGGAWWTAVGVFLVVWSAIFVPLVLWAGHRDLRAGERRRARGRDGR